MSDRLTILPSMATRDILARLARDCERSAGTPVAVLGPLPAEIQAVKTFSAPAGRDPGHPEAAQAVVGHLAAPAAAAAERRQGLDPA